MAPLLTSACLSVARLRHSVWHGDVFWSWSAILRTFGTGDVAVVAVAARPDGDTWHTGLVGPMLLWRFLSALCPSNAYTHAEKERHKTHTDRCSCRPKHPQTTTHFLRNTNITLWEIRRGVALPLNVPDPWQEYLLLTSCLSRSSPCIVLLFMRLLLSSPGLHGDFAGKAMQTRLKPCAIYKQKYDLWLIVRGWICILSSIPSVLVLAAFFWELLEFLRGGPQEDKSYICLCMHQYLDEAQNFHGAWKLLPDVSHNGLFG